MDLLGEIEALIGAASKAPITELTVEKAGWRITISRQSGSVASAPEAHVSALVMPAAPVEPVATEKLIVSPGYGVFHASASSEDAAYAALGQTIAESQQVGIVEAMKVFSPILSPFGGQVAEILVASGADVEAGQPLFRLV